MKRSLFFIIPATFLILAVLACGLPSPSPEADPNAFNTMVALTALARPTTPPSITAPPTLAPTAAPTITGPAVLVSTSVNLSRHTALDLETKAISNPLADMNLINQNRPDLSRYHQKAPPGSDLVFFAEDPTAPDWQFLYPVHGTRMAVPRPKLLQASYNGCIQAFGGSGVLIPPENEALPINAYEFTSTSTEYYCVATDKGNLGAFKLTPPGAPDGMPYVIIDYILWDARLP